MLNLLQSLDQDPSEFASMLTTAKEQFPALTIMVATIGWLTKSYLKHIREIMDDHSRVMSDLVNRNTKAMEENSRVLGSALEALRSTTKQES